MVKSEIKVVSYDESNDTFSVELSSGRKEIDAGTLSAIVGVSDEPTEFVGKVFSLLSTDHQMRSWGIEEFGMNMSHDFYGEVGVQGWGTIGPRFDYDTLTAINECPEFLFWLVLNAEKIMQSVSLDATEYQYVNIE